MTDPYPSADESGPAPQPWTPAPMPDTQYPQPGGYPQQDAYAQPGAQPGSPQPGYPQPYPEQGYPQTGGPQPGYPQYGYAQPVYGQQPYIGAPYPQPPRKSRKGLWITLAIVSVLLVAGCGVGAFALVSTAKKSTKSATQAAPSAKFTLDPTPTPTPTSTVAGTAGTVRLRLPAKLNGHDKNHDSSFASVVTLMNSQLKNVVPNATQTIGGFYGSPTAGTLEMVVAIAAPITDPVRLLDNVEVGLNQSLSIKSMKTVSAGPLGGAAKCGDGKAGGTPIAMCSWADDGSFGFVAFYFKKAADVRSMFVTARGEVETQR